jgi:transposase
LAAGLEPSQLGVLDAEFLIGFIWRLAGRPENAPPDWDWGRDKPLLRPPSVAVVIVLDNYSVHKSARFQQQQIRWLGANIGLFFLPSYSPELSSIEQL